MVIQIPLSASGPADAFAATVEAHRAALAAHAGGPPGVAAPVAPALVSSLVVRVPRGDPLPDAFQVLPFEVVPDRTPEVSQTLAVLRETLAP
jgi:hypothetical protein